MRKFFSLFAAVLFAGGMFAATEMTCAQAAEAALNGSTEEVVVTGYVTAIQEAWQEKFKNVSFWMADEKDGGKVFEAFRVVCESEADVPAIGDKVRVTGTLTVFKETTPETAQGGTFEIIEKAGGEEPPVVGDVLTCAQAAAAARNGQTDQVSVQGYVTEIAFAWKDGSMSFWMADTKDGGQIFEAYKCECAQADAPEVGDLVKVTGTLKHYAQKDIAELDAGCTVEIIEKGEGGEEPPVVGDVLTCAQAAAAARNGQNDQVSVQGYVTEIAFAWKDGSMSFWMADTKDGGQVFEAYKCECAQADAPEVGDLVKVTGTLTYYQKNDVPELAAGCTVEIIEKGQGGEEPPVSSDAPETCEEAREAILALSDGAYLLNEAEITLQGYVTEIVTEYSEQFGNISFWMADEEDGGQVIEAYRAKCDAANIPEVGDFVEVVGKMKKYVKNGDATPEFDAGCTVEILEKGEGGGGDEELTYDYEPDATNIDITFVAVEYADYTEDWGVVDIFLANDEDLDAADTWAALEFITSSFDGTIPAGTYPINDSEEEGTFIASPGGDDESDYPCYVGVPADEEGYYNPFYLVDGTVTISENGSIEVNAESYWGSTIHLVYNAGNQAVENTAVEHKAVKRLRDGQLLIIKGDKTFNAQGAQVK